MQPFLLAAGCVLSLCSASSWHYALNAPLEAQAAARANRCFHGTYGRLSLASCTVTTDRTDGPIWKELDVPSEAGTCVIEGLTSEQARAMLQTHNDSRLVLELEGAVLVAPHADAGHSRYADACFHLLEGAQPLPATGTIDVDGIMGPPVGRMPLQTITVPRRPYTPLLATTPPRANLGSPDSDSRSGAAARVRNITARLADDGLNPLIQAALAKVEEKNYRASVEKLSSYFTRNSLSEGAREASQWIANEFISFGFAVSKFDFQDDMSQNIIADFKGVGSTDEIVVVGAHYDSRSTDSRSTTQRAPGADDNASGISNLLALARLIQEEGLKFYYTIRLVAFCGEEQGLLGSRAYAASLRAQNAPVLAMFNADMLGFQLPGEPVMLGVKDRFIEPWLLSAALATVAAYYPELPIGISASCCSDHQSFTENGFPAVAFFEHRGSASDYPGYHQSSDLPANINFDQVKQLSCAVMAAVMTFAVPVDK